jgi:hypothetical protein
MARTSKQIEAPGAGQWALSNERTQARCPPTTKLLPSNTDVPVQEEDFLGSSPEFMVAQLTGFRYMMRKDETHVGSAQGKFLFGRCTTP